MKIIMKYFTCEGRFSWVYAYHVRLLMHFTRAQLLNLPFFLHRSIENMASTIQKRPPSQQTACLFHHSLIKIVILHQLEKKEISWETFIAHPYFTIFPSFHTSPSPSTHHPLPLQASPFERSSNFPLNKKKSMMRKTSMSKGRKSKMNNNMMMNNNKIRKGSMMNRCSTVRRDNKVKNITLIM